MLTNYSPVPESLQVPQPVPTCQHGHEPGAPGHAVGSSCRCSTWESPQPGPRRQCLEGRPRWCLCTPCLEKPGFKPSSPSTLVQYPGPQQSRLKPQRCGTIITRFAYAYVPSSQPRGCKDSDPSPVGLPELSTPEHTALFFPFCSLLFSSLSHTPSPIMPWPCQPPHQRRLCRTTA